MSNSSLATYVDRSSGNYNRRTSEVIDKIIIHSAMSRGDCTTLSEIVKSSSSSFHYGIAEDGTIGLYVDESYRAWATGNTDIDHRSISIVVCNSSLAPSYQISSNSYNSLIKLCVDICRRNFITKLTFTGNLTTSNLLMHSWFSNVNCPGPYLGNKFGSIASEVSSRLAKVATATSETEALKSQSTVAVSALNPYVATVDPGVLHVNYTNMKLSGVVGVMFYCGGLFTGSLLNRKKRNEYISASLKDQIAELGSTMPYALWCDAKAKDIAEAKQECEELFYVISKYPPKLGIWLGLGLTSTVSTNDAIIDIYYKYLYKWGLHDKCGFYCNRSQLSKITWSKYSSKMSLWLIDSVESVYDVPSLLVPNFFKL